VNPYKKTDSIILLQPKLDCNLNKGEAAGLFVGWFSRMVFQTAFVARKFEEFVVVAEDLARNTVFFGSSMEGCSMLVE